MSCVGGFCQPSDDLNPLAQLSQSRRVSLTGPGQPAGDEISLAARDVHPSQYGRLCPVETPEGAGAGLTHHLALFADLDSDGFIRAAYRRPGNSAVWMLRAEEDDGSAIGPAGWEPERGPIEARVGIGTKTAVPELLELMPEQVLGTAAGLIPFVRHDDAVRALMGSNMQRQAVPLLRPEPPLVCTGLEHRVAAESGLSLRSETDGIVVTLRETQPLNDSSDRPCREFVIRTPDGSERVSRLKTFESAGAGTFRHHRALVRPGDRVAAGQILADGPATVNGALALGRNVLTAFMPWEGYNFEDGIAISEALVRNDGFTSLHVEVFSLDLQEGDTLVSEPPNWRWSPAWRHLGEDVVAPSGSWVQPGDVLIGRESLRGTRHVDSSLRVPPGVEGVVCFAHIDEATKDDPVVLPEGVLQRVTVWVAVRRPIEVGDKLAGRHGNKGVVCRILPPEDMPFLADGTPVEVVVNPLGVPGRMNLGQVFEAQLGWAMHWFGPTAVTPALSGATEADIRDWLRWAELVTDKLGRTGLPESGAVTLYDGRTGEKFAQPVTVGYQYLMKLNHLAANKLHARSTGPYSRRTQQPVGGANREGGQRVGEMEAWALEAHGASAILHEMTTVKSDDPAARTTLYRDLVEGRPTQLPEHAHTVGYETLVLVLRALGLDLNDLKGTDDASDSRVGE